MNDKNTLIVYRNMPYEKLFDDMCLLLEHTADSRETMPDSHTCANQLIELAAAYGFQGNLWHCFLAFCLAEHENAFSTACEVTGHAGGTLEELAKEDFKIFQQLFKKDIAVLDQNGSRSWSLLKRYTGEAKDSWNAQIGRKITALAEKLERAKDEYDFFCTMTDFYRSSGVGKFGLNKAFRVKEEQGKAVLEPITNMEQVSFQDLVGYELQKRKLIENTEAFLRGKAANNVLLFGDAGTGKSSSVKAVVNEYYGRGLRIIEIYKHQFQYLSQVLEQIQDRNYKFIIYMDDLSFEDYELEYKYLKAIMEGGLGKRPENVLIYATSNRRHLIREKFSDKRELSDDLHNNDTVQEKLSLVARFGVTIYFGAPGKKEFQEIVKILAEKYQIVMDEEELLLKANQWELSHGGLSGRTASQFITYLLGKEENHP